MRSIGAANPAPAAVWAIGRRLTYPRLLLLLCGAALLWNLGALPFLPGDEGLYVEASRGMAATGDWIVPRYGGVERLNKPPLLYWLMAGAMRLMGQHEWVARIVPSLAGLLGALVIYFLGRSMANRAAGTAAAAVLLTSVWYVVVSRAAVTDSLLCLSITLALGAFWWALRSGKPAAYLLFALGCAAATLTKGPIGVALPGLVVLVYLVLGKQWSRVRWNFLVPTGVLYLLLVLPWYLVVQHRYPGFLEYAFLRENLERYNGRFHDRPVPFFYLPVILAGIFPWTSSLVRLLLRRGKPGRHETPGEGRPRLFLWLWAGIIFTFFSVGRGKLPAYVLPCFPPLALLVGLEWASAIDARERGSSERWQRFAVSALTVTLALLGGACLVFIARATQALPAERLAAALWIGGTTGVALLLCRSAVRAQTGRACYTALVVSSVLVCTGLTGAARPFVQDLGVAHMAAVVVEQAEPDDVIVAYDSYRMSAFPFYIHRGLGQRRAITNLPPVELPRIHPDADRVRLEAARASSNNPPFALLTLAASGRGIYCLMPRSAYRELRPHLAASSCDAVIAENRQYVLITNRARAGRWAGR